MAQEDITKIIQEHESWMVTELMEDSDGETNLESLHDTTAAQTLFYDSDNDLSTIEELEEKLIVEPTFYDSDDNMDLNELKAKFT